jgi:hypothetical protein
LHQQVDRAFRVKPPRFDERAHRVAGDQLHRHVVQRRQARSRCAVAHRRGFANLVDGNDVRVVQRRGGPRVLHEPGEPGRVADNFGRKDLQRETDRASVVSRAR